MEIAPGIYHGVPYSVYASWNARRASVLKWASKSCAHMRLAAQNVEEKETRATQLGTGAHTAILEPAEFEKRYCTGLELGRRSNIDKAAHAKHAVDNLGKEILDADDYQAALAMRDSLWRRPWAEALFGSPGSVEVSVVWIDPSSGVKCKARIDRYCANYEGLPAIVELKTFRGEAVLDQWQREVESRRYDVQGFMQLEGLTQASGVDMPRRLIWVVFEKKHPWEIGLFSPHDLDIARDGALVVNETDTLEEGGRLFHASVGLWAECERTGNWPGYTTKVQVCKRPPWAGRKQLTATTAVHAGDDSNDLF